MANLSFMLVFFLASVETFSHCAGLRLELRHVDARAMERVEDAEERAERRLFSMPSGVEVRGHLDVKLFAAEVGVGTPPQPVEAIMDTGSDIIWTQCESCKECFPQMLPKYDPSKSTSFNTVPCDDELCAAANHHNCSSNNVCQYTSRYGAGNITEAVLATETFTLGQKKAKLHFGCVNNYKVRKDVVSIGSAAGSSGIIGLSQGALSLPAQLNATKFSYCLSPDHKHKSSRLFVGSSAHLDKGGDTIQSMALVKNPSIAPPTSPLYKFYFLPLQGISVGATKLPIPSTLFDLKPSGPTMWSGGFFIDSGTSATGILPEAYGPLKTEMIKQLDVNATFETSVFDLCFVLPPSRCLDELPSLTFHFEGGADLVLPPANVFIRANETSPTVCMTVMGGIGTNILGNFQQRNIHFLFDLAARTLSFQHAECSSL